MEKIKLNKIKSNPDNPRVIRDEKFFKLVKSLKDFPEMADVRPVVVNQDMVILGGNMRYKAMKEAGWKDAPVVVVDWDEAKQKEFVIKDNASFGEWDWDDLANNWDADQLSDWGIDLPAFEDEKEVPFLETREVDEAFRKGDVIEFGGIHRILIGNGEEENHKLSVLDGDKPFTDSSQMPFITTYLDLSGLGADKLFAAEVLNVRYCGIVRTVKDATEIVEEWAKKFPKEEIKCNGRILD